MKEKYTEMKGLAEAHAVNLRLGDKLRMPWYFEAWYEKVILLIATWSLFYSIVRILFQGFW